MATDFITTVESLEHLGGHYFRIPAAIVEAVGGWNTRLQCTVNDRLTWPCGLTALGEGDGYITLNKTRMTQLKVRAGDEVRLSLTPDNSEYGLEVPEELREVLSLDPEGQRRFDKLVGGKQRFIIRTVVEVKNSQLRIDRALRLIDNLKRLPEGRESFAGLGAK